MIKRKIRVLFILVICMLAVRTGITGEIVLRAENVNQEQEYLISFDSNGGSTIKTELLLKNGQMYGTLPVPAKLGYRFLGWYTRSEGGQCIKNDTIVNLERNQTLYARWQVEEYDVLFHANGGEVETEWKKVKYEQLYGDLPVPQKENAGFLGWYTKKDGGILITSRSYVTFSSNHTLYAHWREQGESAGIENLSFQFGNTREAFGYSDGMVPKQEFYEAIYGKNLWNEIFMEQYENFNTRSFGMAVASILFYKEDVNYRDYGSGFGLLSDLKLADRNVKSNLSLKDTIEQMHTIWNAPEIQTELVKNENQYEYLHEILMDKGKKEIFPVLLILSGKEGMHAVVAYEYDNGMMKVYDPDFPKQERMLLFQKDENGKYLWSYKVKDLYMWGTDEENSIISFLDYEIYRNIWRQRNLPSFTEYGICVFDEGVCDVYTENIRNRQPEPVTAGCILFKPFLWDNKPAEKSVVIFPTENNRILVEKNVQNTVNVQIVTYGQQFVTDLVRKKLACRADDSTRTMVIDIDTEKEDNLQWNIKTLFEDILYCAQIQTYALDTNVVTENRENMLVIANCREPAAVINGEKINFFNVELKTDAGVSLGTESIFGGNYEKWYVPAGNTISIPFSFFKGYQLQKVLVNNEKVTCKDNMLKRVITENICIEIKSSRKCAIPKKNQKYCINGIKYKVLSVNAEKKQGEVQITGYDKTKKRISLSPKVRIGDCSMKVVSIGSRAFKGCKAIKGDLTIGKFVKEIKKEAFYGCINIKNVKMGKNIKRIEKEAFHGCSKMKKVTFLGEDMQYMGKNPFGKNAERIKFIFPKGKKQKYNKLLYWYNQ